MIRTTTIRQYQTETIDLEKIHAVAGNTDLTADEVFDFGKFVIARSGRNHNKTDITAEGQRAAVTKWVGCPVYFKDHEMKADNQIGRIYDAWVEEDNGETVTYGRAFACKAKDDKEKDIQRKIKNRIHKEMSCAYDVTKSECSICQTDTTKGDCITHGRLPEYFARDVEFVPNHVSFVGNPAVEGAGLVTHGRSPDQASESILADDGKVFRQWAATEFGKWYRLNHKQASAEEIESLTGKLSAREMLAIARVEQSRFQEVIPSGAQQLTAPSDEAEQVVAPKYSRISDIFKHRSI